MELITLGRVDLRCNGGRGCARILRQPKRLAVLVYLAASKRDGLCQRDTLVSMFWPDLDEEHARASLRQVLHGLRRGLGGETLIARGDHEVGLSDPHFWCDVRAFRDAIDGGQNEQAAKLYQGRFLDGFFVNHVPEFDNWVESTRRSIEQQYVTALENLAQRAAARRDRQQAIMWWRRLAEHDSSNSRIALQLIYALRDSGDRIAAVQHADQHTADVRRQLGLEPDTAVQLVADDLRHSSSPPSWPLDTPATPPPVISLPPVVRSRSKWRWIAIAGTALLALMTPWIPGWRESPTELVQLPPTINIIAVFPFAQQGPKADPTFDRAGFAVLLAESLDGIPSWHAKAAGVPVETNGATPGTPPSQAQALAITQRIGATRFVLGKLTQTDLGYRATAILSNSQGDELGRVQSEFHNDTDIVVLADDLTRQLAAALADLRGTLDTIALQSTSSASALKAYLQGGLEYRSGNFRSAITAYQDAIRHDSTFAIAWLKLAMTAAHPFTCDSALVENAAERATALAPSLPAGGRDLALAIGAVLKGQPDRGVQLLRTVMEGEPDNAEAQLWMGIASLERCY